MGYGKINVWVRERDGCCVADMNGYAWAQCCCNPNKIIQTELKGGHAELTVPPGCYIVDASWKPGCCGTAKETIAIVGCEQTVCINLIREWVGDPIRIITALAAHAPEAKVSDEEINKVVVILNKIAKTAPKGKVKYYSEEEMKIRREVSDEPHKKIVDKFKGILMGKD